MSEKSSHAKRKSRSRSRSRSRTAASRSRSRSKDQPPRQRSKQQPSVFTFKEALSTYPTTAAMKTLILKVLNDPQQPALVQKLFAAVLYQPFTIKTYQSASLVEQKRLYAVYNTTPQQSLTAFIKELQDSVDAVALDGQVYTCHFSKTTDNEYHTMKTKPQQAAFIAAKIVHELYHLLRTRCNPQLFAAPRACALPLAWSVMPTETFEARHSRAVYQTITLQEERAAHYLEFLFKGVKAGQLKADIDERLMDGGYISQEDAQHHPYTLVDITQFLEREAFKKG